MRLTSALPPQFLLPSWGTRKSYQALQQAHRALQPAQKCPYSSDRKPLKKREGGTVNLFEELFPEYKKQIERKGGDTELEKLPPFQWDGEAVVDSGAPKAAERGSGGERIPLFKDDVADHGREIPKKSSPNNLKSETDLSQHGGRTSRVLILNCASKTLEESDFHRVSPKGQHIQGWTGGIRKVIPLRNDNTLEHEGAYIILFSRDLAARQYLDQTIRLHRRSKTLGASLKAATLPPPSPIGSRKDKDEPEDVVGEFTLVPGYNRLSMHLADRPYKPSVLKKLKLGGSEIMAKLDDKGDGAVLFSVDSGILSRYDIQHAIKIDGLRRNLHWDTTENFVSGLPSNPLEDRDEELFGEMLGAAATDQQIATAKLKFRAPSRHIISFKHRNEARRFVREWHRRPLPTLKGERGPGEEPPPIVNAEIIW